jgi:hypothetical protein
MNPVKRLMLNISAGIFMINDYFGERDMIKQNTDERRRQ